jgi:hypothetical protein
MGDTHAISYRALALPLVLLAAPPFQSSVKPLSPTVRAQLKEAKAWHKGCPVPLSGLRVLTVTYHGMDRGNHTGQLVVNAKAARPLRKVFRKLYSLHFPIRHLSLDATYGPNPPKGGDVSGSFWCREAVPSPCTGGKGTGSWSNHAYGLAVDLNPVENPYVGCGQTRDRRSRRYRDRTRHRRGMVTRQVVAAFRSIGWGWGGAWTGNTKDYMHFSVNGR